jgi:hypothetical protein
MKKFDRGADNQSFLVKAIGGIQFGFQWPNINVFIEIFEVRG